MTDPIFPAAPATGGDTYVRGHLLAYSARPVHVRGQCGDILHLRHCIANYVASGEIVALTPAGRDSSGSSFDLSCLPAAWQCAGGVNRVGSNLSP